MGRIFNFRVIIFFLLLGLLAGSCGSSRKYRKNLHCSNNKGVKQKKYKVKKYKNVVQTTYPEPHTDTAQAPSPKPVETASTDNTTKPKSDGESGEQSIPDLKTGGPPKDEKKIELNGQEISLSEDEDYTYDEPIEFINLTDYFVNKDEVEEQVLGLSELLKNNPNIRLVIVGNTATSTPQSDVRYGDDALVLMQVGTLNGQDATYGDIMLSRAKRVYELLINAGVPSKQLEYRTGSHRMWKRQRTVTFILKKDRD